MLADLSGAFKFGILDSAYYVKPKIIAVNSQCEMRHTSLVNDVYTSKLRQLTCFDKKSIPVSCMASCIIGCLRPQGLADGQMNSSN